MPFRTSRSRSGFTLIEILCVLVLAMVLTSLAAPSFRVVVARVRAHAALDRIAGDIAYTRMLAVREGAHATLRFTRESSGCHSRTYSVVVQTVPERVAKQTELELGPETCLALGTVDSISFNSRGLPATVNNRKVYVRRGTLADSMTVSVLGRVFRWY